MTKPTDYPSECDYFTLYVTARHASLVGFAVEAPRPDLTNLADPDPGRSDTSYAVGVAAGGLRLQDCRLSSVGCDVEEAQDTSRVYSWGALQVEGPTARPAVVGCQLSRGKRAVQWHAGAGGLLEHCTVRGVQGLFLADASTAPAVRGNTFRGFWRVIHVSDSVASNWALGDCNDFEDPLAVGGCKTVHDERKPR